MRFNKKEQFSPIIRTEITENKIILYFSANKNSDLVAHELWETLLKAGKKTKAFSGKDCPLIKRIEWRYDNETDNN